MQAPAGADGSLTDVPGLSVGHFTDTRRPTGCTAILFDSAGGGGRRLQRSAPGESQVVMLQPVSPVDRIQASSSPAAACSRCRRREACSAFSTSGRVGFDWGTPDLRIPIVVSAVIDDLAVGNPRIRPDAEAAYKACAAASTGPVAEGNVGAGAGATVGKMHRGRGVSGMKGGLGTASLKLGDVVIGALAVVNAAGDVLDWRSGRIVAGARRPDGTFADSVEVMRGSFSGTPGAPLEDAALRSTTLAVVATNVELTKTALTKLAMMANCGAARAIRPYHTTGDGDQLFAVSTAKASAFGSSAHRAGIARRRRRGRGDRPRRARCDERRRLAGRAGPVARRLPSLYLAAVTAVTARIANTVKLTKITKEYQWVFFAILVSFAIFVIRRGRECRRQGAAHSHQNLGAGRFVAPISASVCAVVQTAVHHHHPDRLGVADVLERVAIEDDEVRELALLERAEVAVESEVARAVHRRGAQRFHVRHPALLQHPELPVRAQALQLPVRAQLDAPPASAISSRPREIRRG